MTLFSKHPILGCFRLERILHPVQEKPNFMRGSDIESKIKVCVLGPGFLEP